MAKSNLSDFDYRRVAKLDSDMWRAYYNHRFFKMFILLLQLIRTQLHLNWFLTFKAAYHSGAAATNYRLKKGHEDYDHALKHLVKFYKIISGNAREPFDHQKAAELELEWWDIHRYPKKYKKSLETSLADAMATIYNTSPQKLNEYAKLRKKAMLLPNHEGDKQENPPDWTQIEKLLLKSWKSAHQAVQK